MPESADQLAKNNAGKKSSPLRQSRIVHTVEGRSSETINKCCADFDSDFTPNEVGNVKFTFRLTLSLGAVVANDGRKRERRERDAMAISNSRTAEE